MKSFLIAALCVTAAIAASGQDQLSAARDLYTAASYDEALAMLTKLHDEHPPAPVAAKADQYRAFCLYALGRTAEATAVAEQLIVSNPMLDLEGDASPRIAAMFADVRKRMLPAAVRQQYRTARASMDKKDYEAAEPQLLKVRQLLDEATTIGITDETLTDLRVLVDGFLDLARTDMARASNARAAAPSPGAADHAPAPTTPAAPAVARGPQIFDSTATDVTPPVAIRQDAPALPKELIGVLEKSRRSGILEVIIDERGAVERAVIRESVLPFYDNLLVTAARGWKYQPAMKGTTPVKYVKVIAVSLGSNGAGTPQ